MLSLVIPFSNDLCPVKRNWARRLPPTLLICKSAFRSIGTLMTLQTKLVIIQSLSGTQSHHPSFGTAPTCSLRSPDRSGGRLPLKS